MEQVDPARHHERVADPVGRLSSSHLLVSAGERIAGLIRYWGVRQHRDESAESAPDSSPLDVVLREPNLARRRWALAAGAAVVVAAVVALNSLFPPPGPRGGPDPWDVQVRADGDVAVTIRVVAELPALQARLSSEGYPVTVIAVPLADVPPACPPGASLGNPGLIYSVLPPRREPAVPLVLEINPAALPRGDSVVVYLLAAPGAHGPIPVQGEEVLSPGGQCVSGSLG
jgi:hypothetical protein